MDHQDEKKVFTPPRHWVDLEELSPNYWSDPVIRERRAQEFHDKPLELLEAIEKSGKGGIARRDFLSIMAASMAMAGFACARRPVNKIIPYVVKPEEITPGVANWYATTCSGCPSACGVLAKNREGRPIKLEGNPDHPLNAGTLCSRGQASVLGLYDPDRVKTPLVRSRTLGGRRETNWAEVDAAIQGKLKELAAGSGRVRVLSGFVPGDARRRLVEEFLGAFANGRLVEFEPISLEHVADAQELSYGSRVLPSYRFDKADVVVSLGADFLGTWPFSQEYSRAWAKGRKLASENAAHAKLSKLICFEAAFTLTGANADERIPVVPGEELKIALSLAHEIIVKRKLSRFASDTSVTKLLGSFAPDHSVQGQVARIADDLWQARGRSLIVAGGLHSQTAESIALQVAVNLLNSALENEGQTVEAFNATPFRPTQGMGAVLTLIEEMNQGGVDALIVYRSNPAYHLAANVFGFESALKKVPLVIVVDEHETETSKLADYSLPDHHALENWGDAHPRTGIYSLQQPLIAPIHSTRSFEDSLLAWIKGAGLKPSGLAAKIAYAVKPAPAAPVISAKALPPAPPSAIAIPASLVSANEPNSWYEYLRASWREGVYREAAASGSFEKFWENSLQKGVVVTSAFGRAPLAPARAFRAPALAKLGEAAPKASSSEIRLALYAKPSIYDGRQANNAWLQELPDPISSVTWDNYLNIGPALAEKLGIKNDDVVELKAAEVSVELPARVQAGLHPNVVTAAIGYGRRAVGRVGAGTGVDVQPFVKVNGRSAVFAGVAVQLRKTGRIYRLASTQWHTVSENRPIINDVTLAEFRKNPAAANHTDPELRMKELPTLWPVHEYKGERWGMSIDLNSCTGCGACMIACQAENNIPVVGRDQVRNSRQMHWIKIDRYFSGTADKPQVVFQPMLCQHCENAPCETVCPVLATVHSDDGINQQVYNRCVGTRYCQNNCPYKVRRFNFFDHWKNYESTMTMVWNPDVTVRSRGVMEKCTFCTQRIKEAREKAKDGNKDRKAILADGLVKTACQQTCPTNAISFGNMNDPKSEVSKLKKDARTFRVLETQNTKPSISYLTKVRNIAAESQGMKEDHHG